jgi:hypothetical protein
MTYVKGFNRNNKELTEIKDEKGNKINLNDMFYENINKYGTNCNRRDTNKLKTCNSMGLLNINITLSPREFTKNKTNHKSPKNQFLNGNGKNENKTIKTILKNEIISGKRFKQQHKTFDKGNDQYI